MHVRRLLGMLRGSAPQHRILNFIASSAAAVWAPHPPQGQGLAFQRFCIQHLHLAIRAQQHDEAVLGQGMYAQDGLHTDFDARRSDARLRVQKSGGRW